MPTTVQLPRSRGSDFELSYASPVEKVGHGGRKRRSQGCSDDEGKLTKDGLCNEDLRVGGPYLCSVPSSTTRIPDTDPLSSVLFRKPSKGESLCTRLSRILESRGIQLYTDWVRGDCWGLIFIQSKFNPEPNPVPTITIIATRKVIDDTWLHTAREIYSLLCKENLAHVSVEINEPRAHDPPHTSPVQPYEEIYPKWDDVLGEI